MANHSTNGQAGGGLSLDLVCLLRPVIEAVVSEVLGRIDTTSTLLNGKLAFGEEEAAGLLGLAGPHILRDARLRGEIEASSIAGARIRYTKKNLLDYLAANPWVKGARRQRK